MRVLWFEVTRPCRYSSDGAPIAGWQDSLEELVRQKGQIDLFVAFCGQNGDERKVVDGVTYIPIVPQYSIIDRKLRCKWIWEVEARPLLSIAAKVVEDIKPDIIQCFGSEWCWGQVQQYTDVPVVIHMQGSLPPYINALLPPGYNDCDVMRGFGWNIKQRIFKYWNRLYQQEAARQEARTLRMVSNYMGRTEWDKAVVKYHNPNARYFYCSEALRPSFVESEATWKPTGNKKLRIATTGISSFWKGIDTILRTAHLLKLAGVDFEWVGAGMMMDSTRKALELKEGMTLTDNNVRITGFLNADQLQELLLSSDLYVQPSYIDNSPNGLCEAQYLGMPIIATYVGGIPSLVDDGKDGLLVPANDPYTLAVKIMELSKDTDRCVAFGEAGRNKAVARHNPDTILKDLLNCYNSIIHANANS